LFECSPSRSLKINCLIHNSTLPLIGYFCLLPCAGYEWVGWKNESGARPVEIVFEFDRVRNFSAIHLHANNLFSKDVQVRPQLQFHHMILLIAQLFTCLSYSKLTYIQAECNFFRLIFLKDLSKFLVANILQEARFRHHQILKPGCDIQRSIFFCRSFLKLDFSSALAVVITVASQCISHTFPT
jgi:hypothetical protein